MGGFPLSPSSKYPDDFWILLFLQIWVVIKEVGVANILFVLIYNIIYIYITYIIYYMYYILYIICYMYIYIYIYIYM